MQISPRTSKVDLAPSVKKQAPPKSEIRASLVAKANQGSRTKDQDKKGPQAIFIGFEEDDQAALRDPFQKKPALKSREAAAQRSKSTKGTKITPAAGTRRSPDARGLQEKPQLLLNVKPAESPLKRAVKEI